MANIEQGQQMIPFITCEIPLCQDVCKLVLGVDVFDLNCVGRDIVQADHAPEAGVAQGSSMEFSSGTMAGFRKRWKKDLRTK